MDDPLKHAARARQPPIHIPDTPHAHPQPNPHMEQQAFDRSAAIESALGANPAPRTARVSQDAAR